MQKQNFDAAMKKILGTLPNPLPNTATPALIAISGLPGTGKSFLSRQIADRLPCIIVESDFVRKALFQPPTYTSEESAFIHRVAQALIKHLLKSGCSVIYDATNLSEWHRERVYHLSKESNSKLLIVRTVAPEAVIRERLQKRFSQRDPLDISDADWDVHEKLKPELEPIRHPHLVIDTSGDINASVEKILRAAR